MAALARGTSAVWRQPVLWLWLGFVIVCATLALRARYVADLSAFLPSAPTPEQAVLLDQVKSGVAARVVMIGIEGGDAAARADASLQLGAALRQSGLFTAVNNGDTDASWVRTGQFLFERRYLLSPAVEPARFTAEGLRTAIDETVSLLGTPAGTLLKPVLLRDPTGETARMAEVMLPARAPRTENGVWVSRTAPRALLLATTRAEGSDLDAQEEALQAIRDRFAPSAAKNLQVVVSGAGVFGVASRAQIKAEAHRLAIAGSVLVIALLLVAFGSLGSLAIAVLPVATAVLAGIAAVSLGFGQVHGMTLGFGATLVGEAVDYAIYYLIQSRDGAARARPTSGAASWLADSWPTVRLGLLTSLCGFGALVFSGFPGLAQLGVFSMAGLIAAALSTRFVFPIIAPHGAPGGRLRRHLGRFALAVTQGLPKLRRPLQALALAALLAVLLLPSPWHADLAALSPVGSARMKLDAELRADLGASDAGTLLALQAADEAGALAAAEAAGRRLDPLVESGALVGYESPARLLPSPATQAARRAALPDAPTLGTALAEGTEGGPLRAERLGGFIADVQTARTQAFVDRAALRGTALADAVDALLVPGTPGKPWRVFIGLQTSASADAVERVRSAVADVPGARLVQIKQELDGLYARYLREAMLQALLGAAAVCALLALHLRSWRRLLRITEPIAASVLIVLGTLSASGAALGILHLVGFLLVVAIGSNYALFFDHLRQSGRADEDLLASLALANATTVLSFSLLAFSQIPALFAIGQVVAPGALLCLLLSAAFIDPQPSQPVHEKMLDSPT